MKLQFLCVNHRKQLSTNPHQAMYCWQQGYETGKALYDDRQWQEAVPHLGCAFETAEILIGKGVIDELSACNIFKATTVLLGAGLLKMGKPESSLEIYRLATRRLERQFGTTKAHRKEISRHLNQLHQYAQDIQITHLPQLADLHFNHGTTHTLH